MPPRRKKAPPPPVAPTSIIQIPRRIFTSCVAFACTGIAPKLDKLEKTEALIIRVWKALAIGSLASTVILSSQVEILPSFIRYMESQSTKDRTEILRLTHKHLGLSHEYNPGKNIKCIAFSQLFEAVSRVHSGCCPAHEACDGVCICSLSNYPERLEMIAHNLEMENLEAVDKIKVLFGGIYSDTIGEKDVLITIPATNPIIEVLAKDVYKLASAFYDCYASSSSSTSTTSLSAHPAIQFFELMAYLGGAKIMAFANFYMLGHDRGTPVSNQWPFESIFSIVREFEDSKELITIESMETFKIETDRLVAIGKTELAILRYEVVGEISPNVGARVNAACLRLRVAEDTDIYLFQLVIMDCTFALELEPNHVKALFRRGLALCKLKMWKEGIVDFQRAVELDSRSPAKQELEYALRQVGKRIEA